MALFFSVTNDRSWRTYMSTWTQEENGLPMVCHYLSDCQTPSIWHKRLSKFDFNLPNIAYLLSVFIFPTPNDSLHSFAVHCVRCLPSWNAPFVLWTLHLSKLSSVSWSWGCWKGSCCGGITGRVDYTCVSEGWEEHFMFFILFASL